MKKITYFIIIMCLLGFSIWVDRVSAQSTKPVIQNHAVEVADSLEYRFDYYYQQLSLITNSLDEKIQSQDLELDNETELIDQLQAVRSDLETAKRLGHQVISDLRKITENSDIPAGQVINNARIQAVEVRRLYKEAIFSLVRILYTTQSSLDTSN